MSVTIFTGIIVVLNYLESFLQPLFRKPIQLEENIEVAENGEKPEVKEEDFLFKGFANIIPIRGKKKSMDYYLMVLSKDMMT